MKQKKNQIKLILLRRGVRKSHRGRINDFNFNFQVVIGLDRTPM